MKSRYRTLEHLRQIPAGEILARHEPEVALKIRLDHCGRSTDRWGALAAAMTFDYDGEKITFGGLLDSLAGTTARPGCCSGQPGADATRQQPGTATTESDPSTNPPDRSRNRTGVLVLQQDFAV
ncbi:hypothetical protein OIE52_00900 [Streptomyces canus]|uniref:hypothetical protein n=1 Tax=Streptomyces canus TaxID=58343 RepID=UPI0032433E3B